MITTEYAVMETQELIDFALLRDNRRSMEVELAQRLNIALARIDELETEYGYGPRSKSEGSGQKRA